MKKIGLLISASVAACGISIISNALTNISWQHFLLNKGYGEYNKKTGKWQICEPEVVLLNCNSTAVKTLNGGTLTIKDYVKVLEFELKETKECVEAQRKELVDQDILIDKYKKNIKIPSEKTKQLKRPSDDFDTNLIFPIKN